MNVLHVIDSGGLYGAEIMLLHLMEEQRKIGINPIVASIGLPNEGEKAIEAEARRRKLLVKNFRMWPGPNLKGALEILRFARRKKISLLHTHGYKANIFFGFMPRKIRKLPIVATLHGWTWMGGVNRMRFYESLEALSFQFMDRLVLVNPALKHHPRLRYLPQRAVAVVENGIPLNFCGRRKLIREEIVRFAQKGFIIGAIGRLSPEKGFHLLIEAFSELVAQGHDLYLVILGEGRLRSSLEEQIKNSGISRRVLLPGYVADAADYLHLFHLFALPSFTEGLPMVLLEAMAAKTPIVATAVGSVPTVIDQGRAGLLLEAGDKEGLKSAIVTIKENSDMADRMVQKAILRVRQKYSSHAMSIKYSKIYQAVIAENS